MSRRLLSFLVLLLTFGEVTVSAGWTDVFKPKPLHDLSPKCLNDSNTWMNSLEIIANITEECLLDKSKCNLKDVKILEDNFYAIQELDAFGHFPVPGMLEVATLYDGSYQECERVNGQKYDTNYCYLLLRPGKNASCSSSSSTLSMLPIRLAVCLPKSCDQQDMINIFNQLSPYPFTACSAYCVKNDVKKDTPFWGFTIFMIVMVSIALLATVVDYIRETVFGIKSSNEKIFLLKVLLAFSLWTNADLLLSVKEQKPGFIKSLDCIRLFSMLWVLTGHSFIYLVLSDTFMPVINFPKQFWNHLLLNAFVSVDTFFVLSGIVVAYLFFKSKPSKRMVSNPITWIMFYVHRYLRLTPPIMIFIGFFTVYAPYIQGPFAASELNQLTMQAEGCTTSWWRNLLYINNFNADNNPSCYAPTWYLAVDTQLYLVAPVILIAFYFSFAAGTGLITAGCVGSIIATYILFSINDLPADMFGNGDVMKFFTIAYEKPWVRCPPYLVGILTGYLLATYGNRKVRLNWALAVSGWIVAFVIAGFCLFATYDYDKGSHWSVFTRATFYNFHRLGWALFIAWVVSANHMGWGGPISNFMSHPIWQPFGRLSYCAYIVHWFVLFYYLNIGGRPLHYTSAWEVFTYTSIPSTTLAYIAAFFWSCLFEVPTLKLEKMLIEGIMGTGKNAGSGKLDIEADKRKITPVSEDETSRSGSWDLTVKENEDTKV